MRCLHLPRYDIKGQVTPAGTTKNRMAVAEFQGQFMNTSDLEAFFKMFLPDAPEGQSKVYKFHGEVRRSLWVLN